MALVLLPCDLPSWPAVQCHLNQIRNAQDTKQLMDGMQKLHAICCISLDPDENDKSDPQIFTELNNFLDFDLNDEERLLFFSTVLPSLVSSALGLKQRKPYDGLRYSLQQQADRAELERRFVASLLANAFFSTFPRRTMKTHPTLQDGNFSKSFAHLKSPFQRKKLRKVLRYFETIAHEDPKGKIVVARRVMSEKATLDLDDWLSCDRPLCPVVIRHGGKIEHAEAGTYQICFSSDRIGGSVLEGGENQEDTMFCAFPELYVTLLFVETLEKNEALTVHGMKSMISLEASVLEDPSVILNSHVCLIDAADFRNDPQSLQYAAKGILREANKAFIGFHQQQQSSIARLPPIGKSFSSTPPENRSETKEIQPTNLHNEDPRSDVLSFQEMKTLLGRCSLINKMLGGDDNVQAIQAKNPENPNRNILTGLPLRIPEKDTCKCKAVIRLVSKSGSSTPVAHSQPAMRSVGREDSEDSVYVDGKDHFYDAQEVPVAPPVSLSALRPLALSKILHAGLESRYRNPRASATLAVPAKDPLEGITAMDASFVSCISRMSDSSSDSGEKLPKDDAEEEDEDGFASCVEDMDEDIDNRRLARSIKRPELPPLYECRRSIADMLQESGDAEDEGSEINPEECFPLRRSSSTGFVLDEDEDLFLGDGLEHEREWLANFRHRGVAPSRSLSRRNSSRYSFSSDFSSDLDDIYEHFEEKMTEGPLRENPVYSGRKTMKRTLSDSLAAFTPRNDGKPPMPRSLSLTEKMREEMTGIERAKQEPQPPPAAALRAENHQPSPVGTRVSIDRSMSEVEDCVTLPFPAWIRRANMTPQVSVWWNYNRVYDFYVPPSAVKDRRLRLSELPEMDVIPEDSGSGEKQDSEDRLRRKVSRHTKSATNIRYSGKGFPGLSRSRSSEERSAKATEESPGENQDSGGGLRKKVLRRTKSAPDTRHSGTGFPRITRSRSSEDSVRCDEDTRRWSAETTVESAKDEKPRLKKWHAAGDLSRLERNRLERSRLECNGNTALDSTVVADRGSGHAVAMKTAGGQPQSLGPCEPDDEGVRPLATGNWGCEEKGGDPQLKALVQWMAASRANVPFMIYYTGGDQRVVKLNIVCRVLLDRRWSVSHVLRAVLRHYSSKSSSCSDTDLLDSLLPKETDL